MAFFFLSRCCLLAFSTNECARTSRLLGSAIVNEGAGVVSTRMGVPSIAPHVMRGDASAPVEKEFISFFYYEHQVTYTFSQGPAVS